MTRASGRCLDVVRVLRITQGAPAVEAVALSLPGRARSAARPHRRGAPHDRVVAQDGRGARHHAAPARGRRLRRAHRAARRRRRRRRARAARRLRGAARPRARHRRGARRARCSAARCSRRIGPPRRRRCRHESEALAGDDLQAAIAWRGVRAEALARRGEHAAAVELAQAAVDDRRRDRRAARPRRRAPARSPRRCAPPAAATRPTPRSVARSSSGRRRARRCSPSARAGGRSGRGAACRGIRGPRRTCAGSRAGDVRSNAATAMQARFDAALAARDFDAVAGVDSARTIRRSITRPAPRYGAREALGSLQRLFRSRDPVLRERAARDARRRLVPAAKAGACERRPLRRRRLRERSISCRVDEPAAWRSEVFAADQLGAAVARLYERYAELLPEGPARERAAATRTRDGYAGPRGERSRSMGGRARPRLRVDRSPAARNLVDPRRRRVPRPPPRPARGRQRDRVPGPCGPRAGAERRARREAALGQRAPRRRRLRAALLS